MVSGNENVTREGGLGGGGGGRGDFLSMDGRGGSAGGWPRSGGCAGVVLGGR